MNLKKDITKELWNTVEKIYKELADNNPGCMLFLMNAMEAEASKKIKSGSFPLFLARTKFFDIKGERLYKFWNDCCDQNTRKAINIFCENSKDDILAHINDGGDGIPYED